MPTFVPSIFSSTISDGSATKRSDSASPRCLSSSVPLEPKRCGVLGYLTNSSCDPPTARPRLLDQATEEGRVGVLHGQFEVMADPPTPGHHRLPGDRVLAGPLELLPVQSRSPLLPRWKVVEVDAAPEE